MSKKKKRSDYVLLAPAGSLESLSAAIQAGADGVYFGVENLNMRARSSYNFRLEELPEISALCRKHGIKSYLTLNVIMYDRELEDAYRIIEKARQAGIHAIIATDISLIAYARSLGMDVHLSTQLNISNTESLKFYAGYADVMVLARELSLEQVKTIHDNIVKQHICGPSGNPVQLEMFIHGALCMAVSGKCYLSLHEMDASANRGECLQTCRKSYTVRNKESGYELEIDHEHIMSPKDLMTIHFLNKILDAGVQVLKIEGRARGPEYVKTVTECYREAIEAYCEGSYEEEKILAWKERLSTVFNRGFWDGYYLGQKLGEWSHRYGSRARKRKIYTGKISNFFSRKNIAEVSIETGSLHKGDDLLIIGPTTGVVECRIVEIRVDDLPVSSAGKGEVCTFSVPSLVRRSDQVYRWVDASLVKQQ